MQRIVNIVFVLLVCVMLFFCVNYFTGWVYVSKTWMLIVTGVTTLFFILRKYFNTQTLRKQRKN